MSAQSNRAVRAEWVHVQYPDDAQEREIYGFAGGNRTINLEGIRYLPEGQASATLLIYMHPASTLQLLPIPMAMAQRGVHVLCAGSRYARNDTALIMEKVVLDLGEYVRHAKEVWGYEKIVLGGWSGGGSLTMLYQSQAEQPSITETPAGDAVNICGARLIPADAVLFQAAHLSRATMLSEWIDPSVKDEDNPDHRDRELDLYDPLNPHKPPYSQEFVARFRSAQLVRLRKRTQWVKETLERLRRDGGLENERGFVTHRTMADPRYFDKTLEPNDRLPGAFYLGNPETVNNGAVGLARFSTLRSWLSQWSVDDTNAHADRCASKVSVPLLVIENSADDAVPQSHASRIYEAAATRDKTFKVVKGATHYYVAQPELLSAAVSLCTEWMLARQLA